MTAEAARIDDPVAHGFGGKVAFVGGIAVTLFFPEVAAVAEGASLLATAGAAAINFAAGVAADVVVDKVATAAGDAIGGSVAGHIVEGSDDVLTNERKAARVDDKVDCDSSEIAQGSEVISINLKPAARRGDKTKCDGTIYDGSDNVFLYGPPTEAIDAPEALDPAKVAKDAALSAITGGLKDGFKDGAEEGLKGAAKEGWSSVGGAIVKHLLGL